ncbi:MAG: transketolase, partial [Myxococcales bacterium]|nr:transketolase [Myxococcales bacterium]
AGKGVRARVVSLPCWELFQAQDQAYRDSVMLPELSARVAVEAGSGFGWERYLGMRGRFVGMTRFGASAPAETLYEKFGITAAAVVEAAEAQLG